MAKMFYTLDETKAALGKNEEEIKQLAREGRLREFRDGPRLMFKADQVDSLKAEGGGLDQVSLGPSDTGAPLGLTDSKSATGSQITLSDTQSAAVPPPAGRTKTDTAFADIGLSGTIGGVPSPGRVQPGSGTGLASGGTKAGITIFDADEVHRVDASAQTAIGAGVTDQVNLEGVGSGSGLLDLTRESDDTSLGAVFDELAPQPPKSATAAGAMLEPVAAGSSAGLTALADARGARGMVLPPTVVEAPDASAPAFGAMALAGALVVCFGGFLAVSAVMGFKAEMFADLSKNLTTYILAALGVVIVFGVVGFMIGKATQK
jgi:hypothetical protein